MGPSVQVTEKPLLASPSGSMPDPPISRSAEPAVAEARDAEPAAGRGAATTVQGGGHEGEMVEYSGGVSFNPTNHGIAAYHENRMSSVFDHGQTMTGQTESTGTGPVRGAGQFNGLREGGGCEGDGCEFSSGRLVGDPWRLHT